MKFYMLILIITNINVNIDDQTRWIWTAVMLVIKLASNIFLTSSFVSPPTFATPSIQQKDTCSFKVSVYWKQLQWNLSLSDAIETSK